MVDINNFDESQKKKIIFYSVLGATVLSLVAYKYYKNSLDEDMNGGGLIPDGSIGDDDMSSIEEGLDFDSSSTPKEDPNFELPIGNRDYKGITLLDYKVNLEPGFVNFKKPFPSSSSPLLSVDFQRAQMLGLCRNPTENAKKIAKIAKPTNEELNILAKVLQTERNGGIGKIAEQRERIGFLWSILNRVQNTGRTIKGVCCRSDLVSYYKSLFDVSNSDVNPNVKKLVEAFFDGHFNNEVGTAMNWVHASRYLSRFPSWTLPSGTLDQSGNMISRTSKITPTSIGQAIFSKA